MSFRHQGKGRQCRLTSCCLLPVPHPWAAVRPSLTPGRTCGLDGCAGCAEEWGRWAPGASVHRGEADCGSWKPVTGRPPGVPRVPQTRTTVRVHPKSVTPHLSGGAQGHRAPGLRQKQLVPRAATPHRCVRGHQGRLSSPDSLTFPPTRSLPVSLGVSISVSLSPPPHPVPSRFCLSL